MGDFRDPINIRPKSTRIKKNEALSRSIPVGEAGLNVTRLGHCKGKSRSRIDGTFLDSPRCTSFDDPPKGRKFTNIGIQPNELQRVRINNGKYGYNIFNAGL
jgi:hypothetical protein